ncbi:hypothetical protein [Nocardioides dongxiaopingii]|uniref:hypothetical protein n=1 Tax=Nocardioides dongxiaopingii TaxID=2576036 RepID=UPI0010C769B0|nr:hypothetical protein [Nocardioides dongxiaopingii]
MRTLVAPIASATVLIVSLAACSDSDSGSDAVRSGDGPAVSSQAASGASAESEETGDGTTSETPPEPAEVEATTSRFLTVEGKVQIPDGEAGELAVVMTGTPDGDSLPIVVRNRTEETLTGVAVAGTVRKPDGTLAGSGESQGLTPMILGPGEYAVGYVYFGGAKLSKDSQYDLTATGDPLDGNPYFIDMPIAEVNRVEGDYGDQFVGIVTNDSGAEVTGPVSVSASCFEDGIIVSTDTSYAEPEPIPAGGTAAFSIDIFDDACPQWIIGSNGYGEF